jgi:hypothetical protein
MGKMKEDENASTGVDKRFWKPEAPKEGKNTFRIRMLPSMKTDAIPWIKLPKHQFKGPTGWFVENCPSAIGHKCPIDEHASVLFNTGDPQDEIKARMYYRKKRYVCNILVVKDPRDNGANEGKVFLFEFGQKLYDKFYGALFPEGEQEQLIFIDPVNGYDIFLKVKTVAGFPNYDESEFAREASPLANSESAIDKILESAYDIQGEFLADKNFKSYDELDILFKAKVLNVTQVAGTRPKETGSVSGAPAPAPAKRGPDIEELSEEEATMLETKPAPAKPTESKPASAPASEDVDPFLAELQAELQASKK